jgi:hypothetical protein
LIQKFKAEQKEEEEEEEEIKLAICNQETATKSLDVKL